MELTTDSVQRVLINEISDPTTSYERVTALYQQARAGDERWDWPAIDAAVVARFGVVGLAFVQARAAVDTPVVATA